MDRKHPVARIRKVLGLNQDAFAKQTGYSTATIRSIESGRLRLSERFAQSIAEQTGVSVGWLLSDGEGPPITPEGKLFCADDFIERRAGKIGKAEDLVVALNEARRQVTLGATAALISGLESGRLELVAYKLRRAVEGICREMTDQGKAMSKLKATGTKGEAFERLVLQSVQTAQEAMRRQASQRPPLSAEETGAIQTDWQNAEVQPEMKESPDISGASFAGIPPQYSLDEF